MALPEPAADVRVGGGGRFLILHLPTTRRLAVFDVSAGRVVRYTPTARESVLFAAGRDALLVVYPDAAVVERWSLTTFEKEASAHLPGYRTPVAVAMGADSVGPLVVAEGGPFPEFARPAFEAATRRLGLWQLRADGPGLLAAVDPATLRRVGPFAPLPHGPPLGAPLRADPRGTVVTLGISTALGSCVVRDGGNWTQRPLPNEMVPAVDGRAFYSVTGFGVTATRDGMPVGGPAGDHDRPVWYIPPPRGPFLYSVRWVGEARTRNGKFTLGVHPAGDPRPLFTVPDLPELDALCPPMLSGSLVEANIRGHVFPVPEAGLLVTLAATRDRLVLRRLDTAAEYAKVTDTRLVVTTAPLPVAPGGRLEFRLAALARGGRARFEPVPGPPGLAVTADGLVTWDVPAAAAAPVAVRVTVTAEGQELDHEFRIDVEPDGPPPTRATRARPADEAVVSVVRPPRRVVPITPTEAADGAVVRLPGRADEVCYAGGGRFVVFRLPAEKAAAVLDVCAGKVAGTVPLPSGGAKVAAGMSDLFVVDAGRIERWSLTTFKKETAADSPFAAVPADVLAGHATDGPLFLGGRRIKGDRGFGFVTGATLDVEDVPFDHPPGAHLPEFGRAYPYNARPRVRASADGRVYAWWGTAPGYDAPGTIVLGAAASRAYASPVRGPHLVGPDGTVLTLGGLYTPTLTRVQELRASPNYSHFWERPPVPAAHGPLFVEVNVPPGAPAAPPPPDRLLLRLPGHDRPVAVLPPLEGLKLSNEQADQSLLPVHDRVRLVPGAKVLALVNQDCERVHLHRLDTDALLAASGLDYLFVDGWPPPAARGRAFEYAPAVKSSRGGVRLRLDAGPPGMAVRGDRLVWDVPANFGADEVEVLLNVTDAAGREVCRMLALAVGD